MRTVQICDNPLSNLAPCFIFRNTSFWGLKVEIPTKFDFVGLYGGTSVPYTSALPPIFSVQAHSSLFRQSYESTLTECISSSFTFIRRAKIRGQNFSLLRPYLTLLRLCTFICTCFEYDLCKKRKVRPQKYGSTLGR
jgi:hypothetical protein